MKATGIVRRMDELGRIVIPKEIRRNLKIRQGDALEIYIERDALILKKYAPVQNALAMIEASLIALSESFNCTALFVDRDGVVSAQTAGNPADMNQEISAACRNVLESRKCLLLNQSDSQQMLPLFQQDGLTYRAQLIVPVIADSEVVGGILMFSMDSSRNFGNAEIQTAKTFAGFLAKQI